MPEKQEKIFVDGAYFSRNENSPEYIVGSLSIKVAQLIPFLQAHEKVSGYVNINIKRSQKGGYYCELNQWVPPKLQIAPEENPPKPKEQEIHVSTEIEYPEEDIDPDKMPF